MYFTYLLEELHYLTAEVIVLIWQRLNGEISRE
jgi:hypothetical protein